MIDNSNFHFNHQLRYIYNWNVGLYYQPSQPLRRPKIHRPLFRSCLPTPVSQARWQPWPLPRPSESACPPFWRIRPRNRSVFGCGCDAGDVSGFKTFSFNLLIFYLKSQILQTYIIREQSGQGLYTAATPKSTHIRKLNNRFAKLLNQFGIVRWKDDNFSVLLFLE